MVETPIASMPQAGQIVSLILWGFGAAAALVYAIVVAQKEKLLYPIYVAIGSLVASPYEAVNNVFGHCLHPQFGQISAFTVFDRPLPLGNLLAFILYFGAPTIFLIQQIRQGKMTAVKWWQIYAFCAVSVMIVEFIAVRNGMWLYYGDNQPLKIFGVPLWWVFVNASSILSVTLIVYVLYTHLLGERYAWLLVPLYPLIVWTGHGAPSFPSFITIATSGSLIVTTLGSCYAILMALVVVWLGTRVAGIRDNKDKREM